MGISKFSLPDVATSCQNLDRALAFLKEVKNRFKEDKNKYDQFLKLMRDLLAHREIVLPEVIGRVKDFLRGHWALIAGFNSFLPEGHQITLLNKQSVEWLEIPVEISAELVEEMEWVAKDYTKRKERVGDGAQDNGMLSFNLEKDEREEINRDSGVKTKASKFQVGQSSVQLVEIFPELVVDMKEVAKHHSRRKEKIGDWAHDNGMPSSNLERDEWKRMKKKKESSELEERDKAMKAGDVGKEKDLADSQSRLHPKWKSERIWKHRQAEKEKDLAYLQRRLHPKRKSERIWKQRRPEKQNESSPESLYTSITELAELSQSSWEQCTPSYRRLPASYKMPLSAHRTDLAQTVINDNWISVKSVSGNFSVDEKSVYEKIYFRFEDNQYESDMGIERMVATVQSVDAFIEYIKLHKKLLATNFKRPLSTLYFLEQHLSVTHMSCIEMIYRDDGLEFMDSLRENPEKVLPEVLIRLKQKHHELSLSRHTKMEKKWAEVRSKAGLG